MIAKALLFITFVVSCCSGVSYAQPRKLVIAYTTIAPAYAPLWVATDRRFFEKHGVDVEVLFMRGATMGTQALVSGAIDFMYAGGSAAVEAGLSGAEIVIVAVPANRLDQVLVARKEIAHPEQLKGKRIAVNSLTGTAILALKIMLNALGFNPEKDVTYMALGDPPSRFAAVQSGLVEAAVLNPPFTLTAKNAGLRVFDDIPVLDNLEYPSASLIVRREALQKEQVAIEKVTRAIIEAVHFFKTNKPESKRILQKYLRLQNPEEIEEAYVVLAARFIDKPLPTVDGVATILNWSRHPKAKGADPARFIAPQFVQKLDREGFIRAVVGKK
jgi:ABC-type nitrate/sulfonate/bicarbonate transport system substrate-binding protein